MGEGSKIEWCDHTFNPWEGCTKVSAGCANCYAEARNRRFGGGVSKNWGPGAPRRRTSEENWKLPPKWNRRARWNERDAEACGREIPRRPRVFCASLADWLDPEVPTEWLFDLLDLIRQTPQLDWLLLTKRPELWEERMIAVRCNLGAERDDEGYSLLTYLWVESWLCDSRPPPNVWVGTSAENQEAADERIPPLLGIPARVRFLSCEPLIGAVDLAIGDPIHRTAKSYHSEIHWVIAGGESGKNARPMHPDWACSLRDQCREADVPFFFKQWGEWFPRSQWENSPELILPDDCDAYTSGPKTRVLAGLEGPEPMHKVGKTAAGRLLDGREWNEFPEAEVTA